MSYTCERCNKKNTTIYGSGRFCSKRCAHRRSQTDETKKKISNSIKVCEANLSGRMQRRNILRSPRIEVTCKTCKTMFTCVNGSYIRKYCSRFCSSKNTNLGGNREGSGRSKCGWYNGIYCGSSWELAFLVWSIDMNLPIKRCEKTFTYYYESKIHTYLPDFEIGEFIIEIKGYDTKQFQAKLAYCSHINLLVFRKQDLQGIIKHVKDKYGNSYTDLYQERPTTSKSNTCKICPNPCKNSYCSRRCSMIGNRTVKT